MLSLQAITPEPTTSSALVSSTIRTPQLEIRARAAASTIVRGDRAGGGKTRTPRVGRMVARGHSQPSYSASNLANVRYVPNSDRHTAANSVAIRSPGWLVASTDGGTAILGPTEKRPTPRCAAFEDDWW